MKSVIIPHDENEPVQLRPFVDFRAGAKPATRAFHWALIFAICSAVGFAIGSLILMTGA